MRGELKNGYPTDAAAELRAFELEERRRLGLEAPERQWRNPDMLPFPEEERDRVTILFGGLTAMHDALIEAGLQRLGYKSKSLACPDKESLRKGKEFGNRGQCNPTYFTIGNLLKHLNRLRDEDGLSSRQLVENYIFVTVGGCGPCRFGTYITECRKVLLDAGYEGFLIFDVRNFGRHKHNPAQAGLKLNTALAITFFKCLMAGDVINAMTYRIRSYEVVAGATEAAVDRCRDILYEAFREGHGIRRALRRCRGVFAEIEVDRLQPKPKVLIIGEFWAMTTEGDGNYRLQRFLESEGAECEIQLVTTWALYEIWEIRHDTRERMTLRRRNGNKHHSEPDSPLTILFLSRLAKFIVIRCFNAFARAVGLGDFRLPDMDHLARISHKLYPNELRGGEGHMEVAKVIDIAAKNKVHMVISVKPFGCMPSSGVSDGVQSLVTAIHPQVNFCPIETSGDGAVGVYSRVQMALFRARARAEEEFEEALAETGFGGVEAARAAMRGTAAANALHNPGHVVAGTAANMVYTLAGKRPPRGRAT